jgi:hypothetical protein
MMRYVLLFVGLISGVGMLQSQDEAKNPNTVLVTYAIQRDDAKLQSKYISGTILSKVQQLVGAKYESSLKALYKVVPSFGVKDVRVIETFEKRYYADLDIYLRIRGVGFHKDSLLYKFSGTGSGAEEKNAVIAAMNSIFQEKQFMEFHIHLDSLMRARYQQGGDATLAALKAVKINTLKDANNVLAELVYFDAFPEMKVKADAYAAQLLDKRSELFCATELPALQIKVASGMYNAKEVVDQLLLVSPKATCAKDVLDVAKSMGEQLKAKNDAMSQEHLTVLLQVHNETNVGLWRQQYRR